MERTKGPLMQRLVRGIIVRLSSGLNEMKSTTPAREIKASKLVVMLSISRAAGLL